MGFPRQEYWSGLPFPPPGDLPSPGIEPASPTLAGEFFITEPPGMPYLQERREINLVRRENQEGEGNGNPLEYSCLENPMDREAW